MSERTIHPLLRPVLGPLRNTPRLFLALATGLVLFAVIPQRMTVLTRATIAWDVAVALHMTLIAIMVWGANSAFMRRRAQAQDTSATVMFGLMIGAAAVSLFAVASLLAGAREAGGARAVQIALAGTTIVLSWAFIHTQFAIHYAHRYYDDVPGKGPRSTQGGLEFPGDEPPDYWDFVYYSFVIGMTCQVSDVQITARAMRRLTTTHGVLAFLFNTVILALTVNIGASLLS